MKSSRPFVCVFFIFIRMVLDSKSVKFIVESFISLYVCLCLCVFVSVFLLN